jgi:hypothetical protein
LGFKISWIGFQGATKLQALQKAGLCDTGESDEANEVPVSGAEIPGGWLILFSNDFRFASPERVASLSAYCLTVACQVHEGIMVSRSVAFERGASLWQLTHDSQNRSNDLSVTGLPPAAFQSIHDRLRQLQAQQDKSRPLRVEYVFDVPVETAESVCGYRHDGARFAWGKPIFTRLEPIRYRRGGTVFLLSKPRPR